MVIHIESKDFAIYCIVLGHYDAQHDVLKSNTWRVRFGAKLFGKWKVNHVG